MGRKSPKTHQKTHGFLDFPSRFASTAQNAVGAADLNCLYSLRRCRLYSDESTVYPLSPRLAGHGLRAVLEARKRGAVAEAAQSFTAGSSCLQIAPLVRRGGFTRRGAWLPALLVRVFGDFLRVEKVTRRRPFPLKYSIDNKKTGRAPSQHVLLM